MNPQGAERGPADSFAANRAALIDALNRTAAAHEAETARLGAQTKILETILAEVPNRGILDPAAVAALLNRGLLVYDDAGQPINVLEALDELQLNRPELFTKARR